MTGEVGDLRHTPLAPYPRVERGPRGCGILDGGVAPPAHIVRGERNTMSHEYLFFDDFSDGIWTKYAGNPVLVRDQLWAESNYICEPNIVYADGVFHTWFSQMYPSNKLTALGYATSPDGFAWTKNQSNPVLALEGVAVHRPSVMQHDGMYYCFAVTDENNEKSAAMRRWSSPDGLVWGDERLIMTVTQPWEGGLTNTGILVDDDGTWRMLYTGGEKVGSYPLFGYAWSLDGVTWTKYEGNPVIRGFYGGDPSLNKIGDRYYTWHSQSIAGSLRICCRWSEDMIHWHPIYNDPQINYTQPWEHGLPPEEGGTTAGYFGHLTDATLCEAHGKVFMIYQGSQTPLGVATFEGTFAELARRLEHPPLSKWKESPYGMVDGGTLKIADNGSDREPLVAEVPGVKDRYVLECRMQCYAGATHRVSVVMRYGNKATSARFWLHDNEHTYYQESVLGNSRPVNIGANNTCDSAWHDWRVEVDGNMNRLFIDGRKIGECKSSSALVGKLAGLPTHIGFGTLDTYLSIDHVRVRR